MDSDLKKKQPLLSKEASKEAPKMTGPPKTKSRYRRCRSAPSVDRFSEPPPPGFPISASISPRLHPSLKQVAFFLIVYLSIGTIIFYTVRDQIKGQKTNGILDALYFSVVTMTTVGYGDLTPDSALTKLLACAFVFTGMAIIGLLLSKAADYFVERQEELLVKALHTRHRARDEARILKQIETKRVKYKVLMTAVFLVLLIVSGTTFLLVVEKLSLVDSFYCVCSTITTLGYGDKSFSTEAGRVFAIFWILTSTVCVAQFFLYLAELNTEYRQKALAKWVLNRRMTFVELEAADLDYDGVVDAAEFVIYKLKEMGKITQQDISLVLEEFEDLDVDQSGTLSPSDLENAQSHRR